MRILILGNGFDINLGLSNLGREDINKTFCSFDYLEFNIKILEMIILANNEDKFIQEINKVLISKNKSFKEIFIECFKQIKEFPYNLTNISEPIGLEEFISPLTEFIYLKIIKEIYMLTSLRFKNLWNLTFKIIKFFTYIKLNYLFPSDFLLKLNENKKQIFRNKLKVYDCIYTFNYSIYAEKLLNTKSTNKIIHLHGIINDKINPPIIGGLDDKKDTDIISINLKNLFSDKEIPEILEIDIFGFSFDQDDEIFEDIKKLKQKIPALKKILIRYFIYCPKSKNDQSSLLFEELDKLYERMCKNYSYVQKTSEKKSIKHNILIKSPFLFNRFVIDGNFNRYWKENSPINQDNFENKHFDYMFDKDANFIFYVINSEKW